MEAEGTEEVGGTKEVEETEEAGLLLYLVGRSECGVSDYFNWQTELKPHMRSVLLEWFVEVHLRMKWHPNTYFVAVGLLDSFLSQQQVLRTRLQLVGVAALWIAAKMEEVYQVPSLDSLVALCDSSFTSNDILSAEAELLQSANFNFQVTASVYFDVVSSLAALNPKDHALGRYLLEATTFDLRFGVYPRHLLAYSIIYFIKRLKSLPQTAAQILISTWPTFNESALRTCIRQVCGMWRCIESGSLLPALHNKYLHKTFFQVARIRMCQKIK